MAKTSGGQNAPRWPTIAEQMEHSKVTHGSPLEKLVLANQDFSMLRPEEASDNLRLPLWLRVYWRKHHPEATYSATDPTGGYPLALRDLYIWMITFQDLPADLGKEFGGGVRGE